MADRFRLGETWPEWWHSLHVRNVVTTHNTDCRLSGGPDFALLQTDQGILRAEYGDNILRDDQGRLSVEPRLPL